MNPYRESIQNLRDIVSDNKLTKAFNLLDELLDDKIAEKNAGLKPKINEMPQQTNRLN